MYFLKIPSSFFLVEQQHPLTNCVVGVISFWPLWQLERLLAKQLANLQAIKHSASLPLSNHNDKYAMSGLVHFAFIAVAHTLNVFEGNFAV